MVCLCGTWCNAMVLYCTSTLLKHNETSFVVCLHNVCRGVNLWSIQMRTPVCGAKTVAWTILWSSAPWNQTIWVNQVTPSETEWHQVKPSDTKSKWHQVTLSDTKSKWHQVTSSNTKWNWVTLSGTKWNQKHSVTPRRTTKNIRVTTEQTQLRPSWRNGLT